MRAILLIGLFASFLFAESESEAKTPYAYLTEVFPEHSILREISIRMFCSKLLVDLANDEGSRLEELGAEIGEEEKFNLALKMSYALGMTTAVCLISNNAYGSNIQPAELDFLRKFYSSQMKERYKDKK